MSSQLPPHDLSEPAGETLIGYVRLNLSWFIFKKKYGFSAKQFADTLAGKGYKTTAGSFSNTLYKVINDAPKPLASFTQTPVNPKPHPSKRSFTVTNIPREDLI